MLTASLASRLSAARQRHFVGRDNERTLFQTALLANELLFSVLHIFGPGGIGKTTLLGEFTRICEQMQIPAIYLDTRNIEASPEPFLEALRIALNLPPEAAPIAVLAARPGRQVLLLDTYENFAPLDNWLREVFLPQLSGETLIVMASRFAPTAAWRSDAGWQALVRALPLRNLRPEESMTYLTSRHVPTEQHHDVLGFTHGHPLALSLVADVFAQQQDLKFQTENVPDVVKTLLERFMQKSPSQAHRTALEICALARLTTQPLLAHALEIPDAQEMFEWLRELSFIEAGKQGLFPHDLAREALLADLRWRNPAWNDELNGRVRTYYASRLQTAGESEQQRLLTDYIYLHRNSPILKPFFDGSLATWQDSGSLLPDIMREQDIPALLAMVEKHEGLEAAQYARHWFDSQPHGVTVLRDLERQPIAFLALVMLHEADNDEIQADPATRAAHQYLQANCPLRPGEGSTLLRFWMDKDNYQGFCAAQGIIGINVIRHYLTTPNLAYTFFACADPDFWSVMFAYADLERIPPADFGARRFGVYGHNWRNVPPMAWLALLAQRENALLPPVVNQPKTVETLVVLSEPEFGAAVHDALRDVGRLDALRGNALTRSRLVMERSKPNARPNERALTLQTLLKEAAELLEAVPRDNKLHRVIYHTYLHPAATQEQAAELLDLPFSTYRRHLKAGVNRVAELLWQWELQGSDSLIKTK